MGRDDERQARRLARGSGAALLGLLLFAATPARAVELEHRSGGRFALELGEPRAHARQRAAPEPGGVPLVLAARDRFAPAFPVARVRAGRGRVPEPFARVRGRSPLGAIGTAVLLPLGRDEPDRHALENLAIVSEAVMLNLALTITVKKLVARRRPAYFYGRGAACEFGAKSEEKNLSFFSGDSSVAFTLASAATTPGVPAWLPGSAVRAGRERRARR